MSETYCTYCDEFNPGEKTVGKTTKCTLCEHKNTIINVPDGAERWQFWAHLLGLVAFGEASTLTRQEAKERFEQTEIQSQRFTEETIETITERFETILYE